MTITLDPGWISDISMDAYSVGFGGTIDSDRFSRYLSIISDLNYGRLAKDGLLESDGSLKSGAEPLAALLICDLIQSGPVTDLGLKSEDFGGAYSYTKSESAAASTKSAFLQKYECVLAESLLRKGKFSSTGAVRRDYVVEFAKLSQGSSPKVKDSSDYYPTV
jgi:hypothetical protein